MRRRAVLAWLPAVAVAALIFFLSSRPALPSPPGISDKVAHALIYGLLAVCCVVGLTAARLPRLRAATCVAAVALAVLYGATDEFHQSFVPGRTPDIADLVADGLGASIAAGLTGASAILFRGRAAASRS